MQDNATTEEVKLLIDKCDIYNRLVGYSLNFTNNFRIRNSWAYPKDRYTFEIVGIKQDISEDELLILTYDIMMILING